MGRRVLPKHVQRKQVEIVEVSREMKRLAHIYSEHKLANDLEAMNMIKEELKELTTRKKNLDSELLDLVEHLYDGIELEVNE